MHEYSLARTLLRQVREQIDAHQAISVKSIAVTVGEFSGIDAELLRIAFADISRGSPADGAALGITLVELTARCLACDADFHVERFQFVCPRCSATEVRITRGEELMLESLTLAGIEC